MHLEGPVIRAVQAYEFMSLWHHDFINLLFRCFFFTVPCTPVKILPLNYSQKQCSGLFSLVHRACSTVQKACNVQESLSLLVRNVFSMIIWSVWMTFDIYNIILNKFCELSYLL